ncbi:DUF1097 family protein, partial [Salmonella enterica subsp. enterica serovar Kentucky]|nr:DUF1097 family protein [Salmonella enterica subsp. enterica serovar Kentucky]
MVIIHGSALAPHLEIVSYVLTGIVAFLMCIQAKQLLLSFVPVEKYQLKQVINASGRMTALGVSTPRPEVIDAAMAGMNQYFEM